MKKVLSRCEAAIVTSGTATLETAMMGVPQVVVYKGSPVSYRIAKNLIKVKFISLVNLIMDRQLVPELIQSECNANKMYDRLEEIMEPEHTSRIQEGYQALKQLLTSGGGAEAAAQDIISDLVSRNST